MKNKETEIPRSDCSRDADLIAFRFEPFDSQIKIFGPGRAGWNGWGCGVGGPVVGKCLPPVQAPTNGTLETNPFLCVGEKCWKNAN
jgi:hypothetical protein